MKIRKYSPIRVVLDESTRSTAQKNAIAAIICVYSSNHVITHAHCQQWAVLTKSHTRILVASYNLWPFCRPLNFEIRMRGITNAHAQYQIGAEPARNLKPCNWSLEAPSAVLKVWRYSVLSALWVEHELEPQSSNCIVATPIFSAQPNNYLKCSTLRVWWCLSNSWLCWLSSQFRLYIRDQQHPTS